MQVAKTEFGTVRHFSGKESKFKKSRKTRSANKTMSKKLSKGSA
jgi:hypothetical protein